MSHVSRLLVSFLIAAGGFTAVGLASPVAADPNLESKSATAVIDQLQKQGYTVNVNGAPAGDTSFFTTCTVTSIHNPGHPTPESSTTKTVDVDVACPLIHG